MCLWFYIRSWIWERRVVGKKTQKKGQEDHSTFPHEIWLEFYLGIFFFSSRIFWVRLLPEIPTGSYDLEISDNEIMKCSGIKSPEIFNISFKISTSKSNGITSPRISYPGKMKSPKGTGMNCLFHMKLSLSMNVCDHSCRHTHRNLICVHAL